MVFKPIQSNITIKNSKFSDIFNRAGYKYQFIEMRVNSNLIIENSTFENFSISFLTGSVSKISIKNILVVDFNPSESKALI